MLNRIKKEISINKFIFKKTEKVFEIISQTKIIKKKYKKQILPKQIK